MKKLIALSMLVLLLASCSTSKQNIVYMSDLAESTSGKLPMKFNALTIQPDDELMINVASEIPGATAMYNLPFNNSLTREELPENVTTLKIQTYVVNSLGDINFPMLGKIHVAGMTTTALADYIEKRVSETVDNPMVRVELLNFKVQVAGAVKEPTTIPVRGERFTVLDALAAAGDATIEARRDNVLVIREQDGETTYHRIDLTDSRSYNSPYFYLHQNDVVYVEPGDRQKDKLTYGDKRTFNVSLASIIVSSCSVIASLIVAFAYSK